MVDVQISLTARDDLESLPPDVQERIKDKLLNDVVDCPERYLKPLSGSEYQAIRVGDYRVIVDYDNDEDRMKVLAVGHRSTVYDRSLE